MNFIKKFIPESIIRKYREFKKAKYKNLTPEEVFTKIYSENAWGSNESISGKGSEYEQTKFLITQLNNIISEYNIKSILDIPCGDFNWMNRVNLKDTKYIGADIVLDLINKNNEKYQTENITFKQMNLLKDEIPKVDLILVRDCFIHFSNNYILDAINNIIKSNSKYLLTTTYQNSKKNFDITTGSFHPINIQLEPFLFSKPLNIILENCTEGNGEYADKSMGLWEINTLKNH